MEACKWLDICSGIFSSDELDSNFCANIPFKNQSPDEFSSGFSGAAIQIRTGDLVLTKDALYQLSHSSISNGNYYNRKKRVCQAFFQFFLQFLFLSIFRDFTPEKSPEFSLKNSHPP